MSTTKEKLDALRHALQLAEDNLESARRNTKILESTWRVDRAISIRGVAQEAYNDALTSFIKESSE